MSAHRSEHAKTTGSGLLALFVVQVCFALFPVFGTIAMKDGAFTPSAVAFWRIAFGGVVLGSIAFVTHGRAALPRRGDLVRLFVCAQLGVAFNQGLYLEGLRLSTGVNASLLMGLIPVFTYAIAVAVRIERLAPLRIAGIVIALAGTVPLFIARGAAVTDHRTGNLLLATNALSYSFYLVLSKPLLARMPALVVVAWVYLFASPALPWFAHGADLVPPLAGNEAAWWSMGYVLLFPTVLAYLLNAFALARVRASTAALAILLQPFITAVASHWWLGESITRWAILTGACVIVGLVLIVRTGEAKTG